MEIITSLPAWKKTRPQIKGTLGLVPTMGALHEGHLSLVRRAAEENDSVVVWVFINPKQFNDAKDFSGYPRDLEADVAQLESLGVDYLLSPPLKEVYPDDFQTTVAVTGLTLPLEGAARPGHFLGVTTVVAKLFCLTQPTRSYFGQKDAQQSLVISRMAEDLGMLNEVVICPIVREKDGLAMSSRNALLSPEQRAAAPAVHRALQAAREGLVAGEQMGEALKNRMKDVLAMEPLAEVEYVSLAHPQTLEEVEWMEGPALASLAVKFGEIRLIDNLLLEPGE